MKHHHQRRIAHLRVHGLLAVLCWVSAALSDPVSVRALALDDLLQTADYSAPASVVARNRPQVAAEIDEGRAVFEAELEKEMAQFDASAGS